MRILADSNIFIDFWKKPTQTMIDIFSTQHVVICGVVRSELMHGAKSQSDLAKISRALNTFEEMKFEENDWDKLGIQLYRLRTKGITVPFQDAVIALMAVKYDLQVWTKDKHFSHMKAAIPDLQIYHSDENTADNGM